jgi:hypothetical protein
MLDAAGALDAADVRAVADADRLELEISGVRASAIG